jgi:hypothetical protein
MVADLLTFDQIGVDELVVVFDRTPSGRTAEAEMERFETEVVAEYRTARRELDEAVRESFSM